MELHDYKKIFNVDPHRHFRNFYLTGPLSIGACPMWQFNVYSESAVAGESAILYRDKVSAGRPLSALYTQTERFYCVTSYLTEKLSKLRSFDRQ
jgi:hypothetical protein